MSKITKFDKDTCRVLNAEIDIAIKAVAEKYGISIRVGRGTFMDTSYTLKLEIACVGESGEIEGREADTFKNLYAMYGLKETDFHREFTFGGMKLRLVGINSRKHKKPIIVEGLIDKKRYVLTIAQIKTAFGYKVEEYEMG